MLDAQNLFYMLEDCHIACVGIPMGCDLFTIYDSYINCVQFVNMASILSIDQTMSCAKEVSFKSQEVVEIYFI
jgi:hypothetical protein